MTFEVGKLIPFAFQAWDGANGEKGLMMSLSSWNFLVLEAIPPMWVYLVPVFAIAIVALAEWWLIRRIRR